MKYYPVFWEIAGKKCVVIGGGDVAERKIRRLVDCGAKVYVISPLLNEGLSLLKKRISSAISPKNILWKTSMALL